MKWRNYPAEKPPVDPEEDYGSFIYSVLCLTVGSRGHVRLARYREFVDEPKPYDPAWILDGPDGYRLSHLEDGLKWIPIQEVLDAISHKS